MTRAFRTAVLIVLGLAAGVVPASEAQAAPPPTSVTPVGDYVQLWGTTFIIGPWECGYSRSQPATPLGKNARNRITSVGNPSDSGPVIIPVTRPDVGSCGVYSGLPIYPDSITTTGLWRVSLQNRRTSDSGKLVIPKAGIVLKESFYINGNWTQCTRTVGADGPVRLSGSWVNGNPSRLSAIGEIPVTIAGPAYPCGTGTVMTGANLSYEFYDLSNPAVNIIVA